MIAILGQVARYSRLLLVAGLLAGLFLPGLARILLHIVPEMVAILLFLAALSIGHRSVFGQAGNLKTVLLLVVVFQLVLPLLAITALGLPGWLGTAAGTAIILALSAPSISGSPSFSIIMGHNPAPAMQLLVIGTALFPLTVLPVLWFLPGAGGAAEVARTALGLLGVIVVSAALGFGVRARWLSDLTREGASAINGISAIALAIIVIGLMSELGPALLRQPGQVLSWLLLAFVLSIGMQVAAFTIMRGAGPPDFAVPVSIVAGNRNIALFLLSLPPETMQPLLVFLGCYQIPMYLTPILMRRLYRPLPA